MEVLLEAERDQGLPEDFLAGQQFISSNERAIVVDWLILVQVRAAGSQYE